jgi:RHS repeat-associated protein
VLEEWQGGQAQARNVWSPVYVDALVLRDQSSQNNGVLDQRLYVQQDADWNVTALVDTSGNVVERYVYDPFGAVTVLAPNWTTRGSSSYSWGYLYQGQRYDAAAGLYDARGRAYSPALGRPLQADPLGLGPDINDYRWEGDGPADAVDPSGLDAWSWMMGDDGKSTGPGMTTNIFAAIPNNGNAGNRTVENHLQNVFAGGGPTNQGTVGLRWGANPYTPVGNVVGSGLRDAGVGFANTTVDVAHNVLDGLSRMPGPVGQAAAAANVALNLADARPADAAWAAIGIVARGNPCGQESRWAAWAIRGANLAEAGRSASAAADSYQAGDTAGG